MVTILTLKKIYKIYSKFENRLNNRSFRFYQTRKKIKNQTKGNKFTFLNKQTIAEVNTLIKSYYYRYYNKLTYII